jgi:hypothetical protein
MNLLSGFSRKEVQQKLELEIVLLKLETLSTYMKEDEDKPTDLKMWQESMTNLYDISLKNSPYLPQLKGSYHILYTLYLKKHHPELVL